MTALPKTSAPAERALVAACYDSLESLARVAVAELTLGLPETSGSWAWRIRPCLRPGRTC